MLHQSLILLLNYQHIVWYSCVAISRYVTKLTSYMSLKHNLNKLLLLPNILCSITDNLTDAQNEDNAICFLLMRISAWMMHRETIFSQPYEKHHHQPWGRNYSVVFSVTLNFCLKLSKLLENVILI